MQLQTANGKPNQRVATHAIQGFIYQFNKTLLTILESTDDAKVTIEGLIEDIDIVEPQKTTAIQCKYHEGQAAFAVSLIYKPLLQMMEHYYRNPVASINYVIFAHFPSVDVATPPQITVADISDTLNTTNKDFQTYVTALKGNVDTTKFHGRFRIEFGPSLDNIEKQIADNLKSSGFEAEDIPFVIYPNAIHFIAQLSIKSDEADRVITKSALLAWLHTIKKTTISRWTLALKTVKQILDARKKQLQPNLAKNVRRRSFLLSETAATDFTSGVVLFVSDYLDKYHYKVAHTEPPLFCLDCDTATFDDLRDRIYKKGIRFNDGYIGARFDASHFLRSPIVRATRDKSDREFLIRLARYETDPNVLNTPKCDDFFLISTKDYPLLDLKDVSEERLSTTTLQQAKYLLGVSNAYE